MTTAVHPAAPTPAAEQFARRVAVRLSDGTDALPYDISERLRAARVQALAQRKREVVVQQLRQTPAVVRQGRSAVLGGWGNEGGTWWRALASAIPLMALFVGLVVVNVNETEYSTTEVAEVDAALLTDDLPPSAYADPGFVQYLKSVDTSTH